MKKRMWKDADHDVYYFYNEDDGKIVGRVNKLAHTQIFLSVITHIHNNENYLGQYINLDFAKNSVEQYWNIQDRTLIE